MESTIVRDITPCSALSANRRLAGTYRLHLQVKKKSSATNQRESRWPATCFHAGFLLGLFFDPADGGDMFLRNVGWHSTDYKALYIPEYGTLQDYATSHRTSGPGFDSRMGRRVP
jgi:hypothetical protein